MKKTVTLFLVLLATMATMKAQTSSVEVRNLNFRSLNWQLPITVQDTLRPTTTLLSNVRPGAPALGYAIDVPRRLTLQVKMETSFDSYLYLFNSTFDEVGANDDANSFTGSELTQTVEAGRYYIVATTYDRDQPTDDLVFTLTVDTSVALMLRQLAWQPLPSSLTIEDSLTPADTVLGELRAGAPARGYTFSLTDSTIVMIDMSCNFDSYLFLLNNNYEEIEHNDDAANGSRIVKMLAPGTYRIVATAYDRAPVAYAKPFTMSVQMLGRGVMLRNLTATAITPGDTIADSLISTTQMLGELKAGSLAKQYTFRAERDSVIQINLNDYSYASTLYLLDSAYNTIMEDRNPTMARATYSGLYRVIVCSRNPLGEEEYELVVNTYRMPTFYVDPANGNNANNGLTAQTPVASLDSILRANDGIGNYYLMSDFTFTNTLEFGIGGLMPYRRNINFSVDTASLGGSAFIEANGDFVFGRTGDGDYRMTFDHINAPNSSILDVWTPLTIKNITVSNCNIKGVFSASNISAENIAITNDTLDNLIQAYGDVSLSNSVISGNNTGSLISIYSFGETRHASLTIDDCEITNNISEEPVVAMNCQVKLIAGRYSGNQCVSDDIPSALAAVGIDALGGIFAVVNSTIEFGTSFNMDTNNYLLLDTSSRIIVEENYNHAMAKVLPITIDMESGNFGFGYRNGQQVLTGSAIATNYQHFLLAQLDSAHVWSLRADGKLYCPTGRIDAPIATSCTVYPNPTVSNITVNIEGLNADKVVVTDMQGRKVAQQTVKGQQETIDIQHLNSGVYFVQLLSGNDVLAVGKVIKK